MRHSSPGLTGLGMSTSYGQWAIGAAAIAALGFAAWKVGGFDQNPDQEKAQQIIALCAGGLNSEVKGQVEAGLTQYLASAHSQADRIQNSLGAVTSKITPDAAGVALYEKYQQCVSEQTKNALRERGITVGDDEPSKPKEPKTCRIAANGIESYKTTRTVSDDSGWHKGGDFPKGYCEEMMDKRRQVLEPQGGTVDLLDKHESSQDVSPPFRVIEYRYYCTFKESVDPIYKLAASSDCP